jgi:hypothetical protein
MSLKTWTEKYYPEPARKAAGADRTEVDTIKHSLRDGYSPIPVNTLTALTLFLQ